jgi:SNF2 family DNA or RNA helicase
MMETFLNSQSKAIDKLKAVKCGALFMEPGTGKTRSAIELIKNTDADYVLWLTPFQTKSNLRQELSKWGPIDCDIIGIETLQNSDREYLRCLRKCQDSSSAFIVVDESLKIKNATAKRTKRILELSKFSSYRLILNGTPLSRNLLDLWSQMQFLSPNILNMDLAEFKNTFCEYIKITYHSQGAKDAYSREFIKKYHNIDYLYALIQPFIFESKLSLSIGQQHIDFEYNLSHEEKLEHDRLKAKYLDIEWLIAKNNNLFMEITQKMQHNYSLSLSKFEIVDKLLLQADRSKVLIYAKYVDTQQKLRMRYKDVRIMSFQKHSYGLNLQDYNIIIFWDKTWDYAQREQIERRIYRNGQKLHCIYYDLTGNVGLDKLINENIERKRSLLDVFSSMNINQLKEQL